MHWLPQAFRPIFSPVEKISHETKYAPSPVAGEKSGLLPDIQALRASCPA